MISIFYPIVLAVATIGSASGSGSSACHGKSRCFFELCDGMDPPQCGSHCTKDRKQCADFFGQPEKCHGEPENKCGQAYCNEDCLCERESQECVPATCMSLQRNVCPESLTEGICNKNGSNCPFSFDCVTSAKTGRVVYSNCDVSTSKSSWVDGWWTMDLQQQPKGSTQHNQYPNQPCHGTFSEFVSTCEATDRCHLTGSFVNVDDSSLTVDGEETLVRKRTCADAKCTFDCCGESCVYEYSASSSLQGDPPVHPGGPLIHPYPVWSALGVMLLVLLGWMLNNRLTTKELPNNEQSEAVRPKVPEASYGSIDVAKAGC